MRISILVTDQSHNLIQQILQSQTLATQASVARQAFELGLRTLAGEQPAAAEHDLAVLQQAHDQRLEYLTPSLSPDEDEPTLASTPAAIASQPPPADVLTDEQYENEIGPALEVPDPEPSESDELDSFLEALQ